MTAGWRKARRSNANNACVEVMFHPDGTVLLRDSKHPHGAELRFTRLEWSCFLDGVHGGEFELP